MSLVAWYWTSAGLALLGALAAVAARALQDFSRHFLQELCESRGQLDRYQQIAHDHEAAGTAAECTRTTCTFGAGLALAWAISTAQINSVQIVALTVAAIVAMVLFSILIPWAIARHWSEIFLATTWPVWRANRLLMAPLLACATWLSHLVNRVAGRPPSKASEESVEEEIRNIVSEGHREGLLEEDAREMIEGVMELKEVQVSEIMTPRTYVFSISLQTSWDEMLRAIVEAGHTRVPVFSKSRDDITGILHTKDLLRELAQPPTERQPLVNLLRKPFFVPDTKPVDELLHEFQRTRNHIALVLDEFGGLSGLITIEDVLEEIVGEIVDEHDEALVDDIKQVSELHFQVAARVRLEELNERLNLSLPENADYDTIGGLVFHELGRIPSVGEELRLPGARFVVLDATRRRIDRVAVYLSPAAAAANP